VGSFNPTTQSIESAVIGYVDGHPDNGVVYNIDGILRIFADAGYSRTEAVELFHEKIKKVDTKSVFVWPN
jgi:hypothetical protein